jgi:hypothetical protein
VTVRRDVAGRAGGRGRAADGSAVKSSDGRWIWMDRPLPAPRPAQWRFRSEQAGGGGSAAVGARS